MSRNGVLTIIILILMITPALAKEAAYAYGEFGGHLLDNGNITEFKGSDLINFTVAGGSERESAAYIASRTMDSIGSEIRQKINKGNQPVRDEGRKLVGKKSGPRRIDQICSIYDQLVDNWSYVEDWKGLEEFQYSNYSLEFGKNVDSEGLGDCDDFSILLAALVESVGATPRIIFAYGPRGGHAYAEVYLGNVNDEGRDVNRMIKWLVQKYRVNEINAHVDMDSGDVWLNLDWWKDPGGANHPGGRFFSATNQTRVYPTSREPRAPLTALNEAPKILKLSPERLGLEPRTVGSRIAFIAEALDPENDSIYFMFRLNNENATVWKSTSSWQTKNDSSWVWETNNSHIGSNSIEVWVRDGNHANEKGYDNKEIIRLEVKPAVPIGIWAAAPNTSSFSWNSQNFAGFYYDIDEDVGNETLLVNLTNEIKLSGEPPYGLVYTTKAGNKKFKFREWGDYKVIGFLTRSYFAGYNPGNSAISNLFYNKSPNNNSLACGQLEEILADDDRELTISAGTPIRLREGYELAVRSVDIDGNKLYLELSKDGLVVDSGIVIIPNTHRKADETFSFEKKIGGVKSVKIIEVHLKNAFRGADQNIATLDHIWQASESDTSRILSNLSKEITITSERPLELDEGYVLTIDSIDINGNKVYIELIKDDVLVAGTVIIPNTSNEADETFSFERDIGDIKNAKVVEAHLKNAFRGADQNVATINHIWQASDSNSSQLLINSSNEALITSGTPLKLEEGYELYIKSIDIDGNKVFLELSKDGQVLKSGVVIPPNTPGKADETFSFEKDTGDIKKAKVVEVHLKNAFRGVDQNLATFDHIWQASDSNTSRILNNISKEITITSGSPLELDEGYVLAIKAIDVDGQKAYLELSKDRQVLKSGVVIPPKTPIKADETFSFDKDIGYIKKAKVVEVHLKNAFRGVDQDMATIDHIWQASDSNSSQLLINSSNEVLITSGTPLMLEEGYGLYIKSIDIDGNKVYLELIKDGLVVKSSVAIPANKRDGTFTRVMSVGEQKKLATIGVNYKNAFRGADRNLATIKGVWQISDSPTKVLVGTQYDRMAIESIDPIKGIIRMNNKGESIFLTQNNIYSFMPDLVLMASDQQRFGEISSIRLALFKEISLAGDYMIRGSVASGNFSWYPENFSGFFYDIDQGFGTEMLHINLSPGKILSGDPPYGIIYSTTSRARDFKFHGWGTYSLVGFLGNKYFSKYINNPYVDDDDEIPLAQSGDSNSLAKEQLEVILKDENEEISLSSGNSLKLAEGYELIIRSIDSEGRVSLNLIKNGSSKDLNIVEPSKNGATMADKTYYYKTGVGSLKGLTIISVHFKKGIRVGDKSQVIVDGIWQISDTPTDIQIHNEYDKMSIAEIDPFKGTISMDNRDNQITLTKNKDIHLMGDIRLKTADSDTLRYCIYKAAAIGED